MRAKKSSVAAATTVLLLGGVSCGGCADDVALGALTAQLAIEPTSVTFAPTPVGLSRSVDVAVVNRGRAPLHQITVATADGAGAPFVVTLASADLDAGARTSATLTFAPAVPGAFAATFQLRADDDDAGSVALAVDGTAVPPADCDDKDQCTSDAMTIDATCVHEQLTGACDDANACTTGDTCSDGRCVGAALTCEPPAFCFDALCDVNDGCVFVDAPGACDDGDPCTDDFCTVNGCAHETSADGTVCGDFVQCQSLHVCAQGACIELSIPDGAPCSDGDACTDGDVCAGGACIGAPFEAPAALVGFTPTFGTQDAIGAVLDDGRIVVVDPLPNEGGAVVTVLVRAAAAGDDFDIVGQEVRADITGLSRAALFAIGMSRVALAGTDITVFDVDGAGHLVERGRATDALPSSFGSAPALVHFGDVLYACAVGQDASAVVDVSDPSAPVVVGALAAFGACAGLAVDTVHARLLASAYAWTGEGGGLTRFTLTDELHPGVIDHALDSTSVLAATNGDVIAVVDPGPWGGAGNVVTLLDVGDLATLDAFATPTDFYGDSFSDLVFDGDRLFVQSKSELSAWSVGDPTAPTLLFEIEKSGVNNGSNTPPMNGVRTNGTVLFRVGDAVYGGVPLVLDVSTDTPRSLRHPAEGGAQRLAAVVEGGSQLVAAFDRAAIHVTADVDSDAPQWTRGSSFRPQDAASTLWSIGPVGASSRFLSGASWPGIFTSAYDSIWRDASDADSPIALAAPFVAFADGHVVSVVDDGAIALGLEVDFEGAAASVATWDLATVSPDDIVAGLSATGRVTLPAAENPSGTWRQYGLAALATDGARGVIAASGDIEDPFDDSVVVHSTLALVDIVNPVTPALLATLGVDGFVQGVGVRGDRIVVSVKTSGGACCSDFLGEVVRSYRYDGDALVLAGEAPIDDGGRVLSVDADAAAISTARGVALFDLGPSTVAAHGEVALPEPPTSALAVGDRLWSVGAHGLAVVQRPCGTP